MNVRFDQPLGESQPDNPSRREALKLGGLVVASDGETIDVCICVVRPRGVKPPIRDEHTSNAVALT